MNTKNSIGGDGLDDHMDKYHDDTDRLRDLTDDMKAL